MEKPFPEQFGLSYCPPNGYVHVAASEEATRQYLKAYDAWTAYDKAQQKREKLKELLEGFSSAVLEGHLLDAAMRWRRISNELTK